MRQDGFTIRLLSAAVLIPPVLAAIHFGSPYFEIMVLIGAAVLAWEWSRMCAAAQARWRGAGARTWLVAGALVIMLPCLMLLWLRLDPQGGRQTVTWLFAVVWGADTGAYVFGRAIGGPKLAPAVSPAKTWAGLAGGIACAAAASAVAALLLGTDNTVGLGAFGAAIGAVAQGGDLAESWVKRRSGVKDTGRLIPGHGGLMDRVDGLLAAAVAVTVVKAWAYRAGQGSVLTWL